ncbi:hypothetical protein H4Q26_010352 [Puccinia striiformis f. sp. tritici PST-130]|uniref:Uncharacterized protein n=1 Tax=Puccinia striiformis f. sp. tritici PST-78 TaxID=1165861 RepID=A0A0L0W0K9_9BASI|nr:hypothetical protein H4Q26_010352 [Puccinia striiformis f. sp. tritici PST-130]KNF05053.1 hypothetical protein PSTG_01683 [Puccinia striiformis f. sp. tritici PST-78]
MAIKALKHDGNYPKGQTIVVEETDRHLQVLVSLLLLAQRTRLYLFSELGLGTLTWENCLEAPKPAARRQSDPRDVDWQQGLNHTYNRDITIQDRRPSVRRSGSKVLHKLTCNLTTLPSSIVVPVYLAKRSRSPPASSRVIIEDHTIRLSQPFLTQSAPPVAQSGRHLLSTGPRAAQISLEEFSSGAPRSSPPVPQGVLRQYLKEFSGEVLRQYSKEFSGEVLCQYSKEFSARTPIRIQIPLAESADKINFIGVWPPDVNFPWWATIRGSVLSLAPTVTKSTISSVRSPAKTGSGVPRPSSTWVKVPSDAS